VAFPRTLARTTVAAMLLAGVVVPVAGSPATAALPPGFQDQVAFGGLDFPTNLEFAPDGRVFVAEQSGVIKVFDNLADPTPDTFADLSVVVHDQWDRGLLGLALAPGFPTNPWVYVLYAYDAPPGQTAPFWHDVCPNPTNGSCLVTARLSRLRASGNQMTGTEQVLVSDWCQQYPSHSIGDLHFGADGALYVSAGDGASFEFVDYGQTGNPVNPCGDPPGEGGALRAQDVRTAGDPTALNGAVLRLDPDTGAALPDNPLAGTGNDANAKRIIGHGLRNPFRFAIRPGTSDVWIGDVGWGDWEEIDRIAAPTAGLTNFGWPCYEGPGPQSGYQNANLSLCQSLYSGGGATAPVFTYNHASAVVSGDGCATAGGSAITGLAFYPTGGGAYPATYDGALFFADYARRCIWAMLAGTGGLPDPARIVPFLSAGGNPVDLAVGPGGDLYYVDIGGGSVHRIRYFPSNQPPTASLGASPTSGSAPLAVGFDATGSSDPDPADQGQLRYAWDFTNDGTVDATTATAGHTYPVGTFTARLTVTDSLGAADTKTVTISAGNSAPTAVIDSPTSSFTWAVGDPIAFTGHATDPQDGTLPASALTWRVLMHHCITANNCHTHPMNTFSGVAGGSVVGPDHGYPSYVEIQLTATDSGGLTSTASVAVQPKPVTLTFTTSPSGLALTVGSASQTTPFTVTVIQGSTNSMSAPTPQTTGGTTYGFCNWSDGGAQTHVTIAPATATTYTANYSAGACGPPPGSQLSLRARVNTSYVSAADAGGSPLIANRVAADWWEKFDVVDAGGGYVALRSQANGRYVTAENGGASPLIANRATIGAWEKFQLLPNPDGSVSLLANANGRWVTAENGGTAPLIANRATVGAWEEFDPAVAASAHKTLVAHANGRLVTADNAGASPLIANRTVADWWERFDVVDLGGGFVALRSLANGCYVTAENGGAAALIANRTAVGAWETFQLSTNPDSSVSLRANANGRWVTAENGGASALIANRVAVGAWEEFDLRPG
jgi:glucose/arabinose dehydrogenase